MRPTEERWFFAACVATQGLAVVTLAVAATRGAGATTLLSVLALSFLPYFGLLQATKADPDLRAGLGYAVTAGFGAVLLVAPPVFSDDLYRFLWEGRLWLEGANPYQLAPDDASLAPLRDEIWARINNKPLATIYPPLAQAWFVLASLLGGEVWTVKALALLAHLIMVGAAHRVSADPRVVWVLGLNPLLLTESALNGHFDALVGATLLLGAWCLGRSRWLQAVLATVSAVGLKVVGLVLVPLFVRHRIALVAVALGSGVMLTPFYFTRSLRDPSSGAGEFARRWQGNESLFAAVEWLSDLAVDPELAPHVARVSVALGLGALALLLVTRRVRPLAAGRALLWGVLLLSPQVHPWYLAWLLPFEAVDRGRAGFVWSAAVLLAYLPLDRWAAERVWEMPLWAHVLEYGLVVLALALDDRRPTFAAETGNPGLRQ